MDIIFGVYNGYNSTKTGKGGIYYFAKSLRKYNKDCTVIILCEKENIFNELEDLCKQYNIHIFSNFTVKYALMFYRFELYYQIITQLINEPINKILLSDIDDVIFQGDPFSIVFSEDIYCAAEQNLILAYDNWSSNENRKWINESIDTIGYDNKKFENQCILCAGTILGTSKGITEYLMFYCEVQNRKIVNDQGLYNICMYNYTNDNFRKILPVRQCEILTLDLIDFNTLNIHDGKIINDNGEIYKIIHQINRCNPDFMRNLADS